MGKAFPQDTRETFYFARLSFLIHTFYAYPICTHITHRCWGVLLRENPSHKPWELEIVIPIYLYTFMCGFSSTPTSPFPYHWEIDSSNTSHILFKVFSEVLVLLGSIGRSEGWQMQHEACCRIQRARQDMVLRSLVGVGAWKA